MLLVLYVIVFVVDPGDSGVHRETHAHGACLDITEQAPASSSALEVI